MGVFWIIITGNLTKIQKLLTGVNTTYEYVLCPCYSRKCAENGGVCTTEIYEQVLENVDDNKHKRRTDAAVFIVRLVYACYRIFLIFFISPTGLDFQRLAVPMESRLLFLKTEL